MIPNIKYAQNLNLNLSLPHNSYIQSKLFIPLEKHQLCYECGYGFNGFRVLGKAIQLKVVYENHIIRY